MSETVRILTCESLAFVFYFLYGSFFEWAFHKYLFHSPKFIKATYRAHHLVHHQRYQFAQKSYEIQPGMTQDHITMDWFALPLFLGFHLPFIWFFQWATGIPSLWGGLAAITAYYAVYEFFHFHMHVPGNRWFERLKAYRFAKEHHRIHHRFRLQNLNVFFPLADLCLGTYISAKTLAEKDRFHYPEEVQATNPPASPNNREAHSTRPVRLNKKAPASK